MLDVVRSTRWTLDVRPLDLGEGLCTLDVGQGTLGVGCWTWTLDIGRSTLNVGRRTFEVAC